MIDAPADETVSVTCTVSAVRPVLGGGKLLALADAELIVAGVAIELRGVPIVHRRPGAVRSEPPAFRDPAGAMIPAVVLPPEQAQTMFNAVLDVYEEQKRLPWLPPG